MPARTIIELPVSLQARLKERSRVSGASIHSLVVRALEETYAEAPKKRKVTGPLICGTGKLGPRFPMDENPHDLVLS